MLPIALNPSAVRIGLAGAGAPALRRLNALRAAGVAPVLFAADAALGAQAGAQSFPPDETALAALHMLYVAGLEAAQHVPLVQAARAAGVLVNVEDVPEFCDFHAVAEIRRGDLLLTVSTGGAAPGLAGVIRRALENLFPPVWAERVAEVAALREGWRAERIPMAEAARRIADHAVARCWLPAPKAD
ncbi:bifunctional precorrin-2 dehydrogenase/sirohydrochlorin ferrochelatase [Acidocella sp.]|uniref:precorrin-2 dehydrogenase/sirohydrochlorin ferrochelatase family protein n=1 Tax=Acidocella sp. TaxID=50710 RepID=UPI0026303F2D|nr:NAD(P)-dependent oxidoreductase [Acidocella sp.]